MPIEQLRAKVMSRIWQAVAQSGVDLSSLEPTAQDKLVNQITDSMLQTLDELLDEAVPEKPAPAAVDAEPEDEHAEKILWQGRPFLSLVEHYTLTSERLKIVHGMLGRDIENFELIRIQDIDLSQGAGERILNIGDIEVRGQDPSKSLVVIRNIKNPEEVYEILRRAWQDARKRYGLQFREYM
jgi:hypothetical protein